MGGQATKIDWKDDSKNLTKQHPQLKDEDDDLPSEGGSFFNFFEVAEDPFDVRHISNFACLCRLLISVMRARVFLCTGRRDHRERRVPRGD